MIIMVVSLVFISTLCVPHVMVSVFASDVVDCGCEREGLLINTNSDIFQLYHGEIKWHFDEIMSTLD
jgi:competence protein ComGC